ncbi:hypothetical protein [Sphingomonas sp.]|uniref:hypothetical protein n=1 Tax=Sphingomonas sp. TaxID=28214 RepID=UPI0038A8C56B
MIGLAIEGLNIIDAWVRAARAFSAPGFANDHIAVVASNEWIETPQRLRALDDQAKAVQTERPSSVANVLCPAPMITAPGNTLAKITRGWEFLGRGRQQDIHYSGWKDTYFERLTGHRAPKAGEYEKFKENRLLSIITKINSWNQNVASALYAHSDIPSDTLRTRGAPCLQYVQFRVFDGDKIGVTGLYRSHDYLSKALGNMIGLQRLARFVAQETGRNVGRVTVISLVPIAQGGKGKLRNYANGVAGLYGF